MKQTVRLDGIIEDIIEKFVGLGYFKSKSDVIRMGILVLAKEYDLLPKAKEIKPGEKVKKKVKKKAKKKNEINRTKTRKMRSYPFRYKGIKK